MRILIVSLLALLLAASPLAAAEPQSPPRDGWDRVWDVLSLPWMRAFPVTRRVRDQLLIAFFPRYPYRDGRDGYLVVEPAFRDNRRYRLWGGRIGGDVGAGTDDTRRGALDLRLDSAFRFGAQLRLDRTWDDGGSGGLAVGTYRMVQHRRLVTRFGLGPRWSTGRSPGIGVAATLGIDIFPARPWVISLDGDVGSIGTSGAGGARVQIGYLVRAVEFDLGFLTQTHPEFHGPIAGVAYWF
ncbi:MAG: hypothetical protein H0V44_04735 [Planctomycetes bacterium]|nr:hypothetical protein [Planctomycetota bacterium]